MLFNANIFQYLFSIFKNKKTRKYFLNAKQDFGPKKNEKISLIGVYRRLFKFNGKTLKKKKMTMQYCFYSKLKFIINSQFAI